MQWIDQTDAEPVDFDNVATVIRKESQRRQAQDETGPAFRHVRPRSRNKNEVIDQSREPLQDRAIAGRFDFRRVKPDREIEPRCAAIFPQGVKLGDSGTDRALDALVAPRLGELAHFVTDQEHPARRKFAGDKAREIGTDGLEKTRLHEGTL